MSKQKVGEKEKDLFESVLGREPAAGPYWCRSRKLKTLPCRPPVRNKSSRLSALGAQWMDKSARWTSGRLS